MTQALTYLGALRKLSHAALLPILMVVFAGCQVATTTPSTNEVAATPDLPPDYNLPEGQFVKADFNTLGSEFRDEYVGQYVVFDGTYTMHQQTAQIGSRTGIKSYGDIMSAFIRPPAAAGSATSARSVTVHWSMEDRDLGRPLLNLQMGAPLRIFGYVLPANKMAAIKSRKDQMMSGFEAPVVLLIKAEPLSSN